MEYKPARCCVTTSAPAAASGGVKGDAMYGKSPTLVVDGPDDAGNGARIHSTSVDQYAATMAKLFDAPSAELNVIFPNLSHFPAANLGFMS